MTHETALIACSLQGINNSVLNFSQVTEKRKTVLPDKNKGADCIFELFFFSDPPHLSPAGPSVASLKKDCGTKFGPAQKKGLLKWQQTFIVLRQGDDTLYEFRTDLVCIAST